MPRKTTAVPLRDQIKLANLAPPVEEYQFWHGRRFAFDFAWPAMKLAVEIEGGIYGRGKPCPVCRRKPGGAHSSIKGMLRDVIKYNRANFDGWMLIRVLPDDVASGKAINMIEYAMLTLTLRSDKLFGELGILENTLSRETKIFAVKRWKALKLILKEP